MSAVAGQSAPAATIEPELLQRLHLDGRADFFVKMAAEADLTAAMSMDWQSRGEYVWNALNEVARAAQAPVLEYARQQGLDARSLLISDSVYIRGADLASAQALAALPGVAYLRLERIYSIPAEAPLPEGTVSWGLTDVKAPDVWALGFRGAGSKVANIDTGVQWNHPALINEYGCSDNPGDPKCWYDPANICGGTPCDNVGHGTHTIGTAVAKDDPGFPYIAGVAPEATWIACKGCESSACSEFALNACADWIVAPGGNPANRPYVVDNSWGGSGGDPWFEAKVQAWHAAGVFPIFAAGGSGPGCGTLSSPCDYEGVFCVTGHDENRIHAQFASSGPGAFGDDPYTKPNISAPGVNIWSTVPTDSWASYSGTSTSVPHAGGAVALAWEACPDLVGQVDATFQLLQDNADPPPPGYCGAPPDNEGNYTFGYGYLNILNAVQACAPGGRLHINKMKMTWAPAARPGRYKLTATARIQDDAHLAASGATVLGDYTYPDGTVHSQSAVTNLMGVAKFRAKTSLTGVYNFCVTDVTKAGYLYDPGANEDGPCKSVTVTP